MVARLQETPWDQREASKLVAVSKRQVAVALGEPVQDERLKALLGAVQI